MNPKINRDLKSAKMHFGPNLESLTLFGIDLSPGQTHKPTMG